MADIRTSYTIAANTWVLVVNGKQSGAIRRKIASGQVYMNLVYNDAVSDPNVTYPLTATTNQDPATSAPMFEDSNIEPVADPVPIYIWVACKSGKAGKVLASVV